MGIARWSLSATFELRVGERVAERGERELLKGQIREAGLRATGARIAVLECLVAAATPLTHADVCERLEALGYDRATLYRNLVDLTGAGLVTRTDLGDHLWRFELSRDEEHEPTSHAHFVCQECGDVSCLPEGAVSVGGDQKLPLPRSLERRAVEIQVRGVCNDCD